MRLIAFPQWDKLTSLLRGMARQSAADYAQRNIVRIIPKNGVAHLVNNAVNLLAIGGRAGARFPVWRADPERPARRGRRRAGEVRQDGGRAEKIGLSTARRTEGRNARRCGLGRSGRPESP